MTSSAWQPLFSDADAEPYGLAIDAIVSAIDHIDTDPTDWGRPLLHVYLAKARSSPEHRTRGEELVELAIDTLATRYQPTGLYSGVAGAGWLSAHTDACFDLQDDDAYEQVDDALLRVCGQASDPLHYDLISGSVGLGVYFLERLPHPSGVEGLRRVILLLERYAERRDDRITWLSAPTSLSVEHRSEAPDGCYNLGVAHGVPGIIGILGEICRAGISPAMAAGLLIPAIRWVLDQRLQDGLFPYWVFPGIEPRRARIAWCYGALGLSVALLAAARALDDREIEGQAIDIALAAARHRDDTGVIDAGLCHGAAGNAHLFNRLFQATRRPEFRDAAVFWFHRTLALRVEGVGVAGFRAWKGRDDRPTTLEWQDDPSFLMGASGIALALLAATTPVEPTWDRVLLSCVAPIAETNR